jgi:ring-1,2-phenylacetyl-CoA epoxidase subunit PaaE
MSFVHLTIRSIKQETPDTKTFTFEKEPTLHYQAGQFLTIVKNTLTHEVRRQYSFTSHPKLDEYPSITVKRIANGEISRWLFDEAKVDDTIKSVGSSGQFTLPTNTHSFQKVLFLAAGSGITPILSLIKEVLYFQQLEVVLIYSNHTEASIIFLKELRQLQTEFVARLKIEFLFSDAKNLMRARLGKSILEELFQQYVTSPQKTLAYVCGPLDYRQMAMVTLLAQGIPNDQLHKEVFHTPPARMYQEPPDKDEHVVRIQLNHQVIELQVQYPTTILAAAKKRNINLPYSCEAGRCGTCAASCISGEVWMSRNEVLTDRELEQGRVLTCTAYPIESDVELIIK